MDENLKREIIMDNYSNPYHKDTCDDSSYEKVNTRNVSCIDNLDIYVLFDGNLIKDIIFNGEACAISTSSTSIMIKNLIGKDIHDAIDYINNFDNMVNERDYSEDILNEAIVYDNIYKQGNRKTCATLPYVGIKKLLMDKIKEEGSN